MRIREFGYVACFVAVAAVPGCGNTITGTAVAAEAPIPNDWRSPAGTWVGTYKCAQGTTGLTLTVNSRILATFEFYPTPENPKAASGSFAMHWQIETGNIVFRQSHWIDRPGSYLMVDLVADRTDDTTVMTGKVVGTGCTTFRLTRNQT